MNKIPYPVKPQLYQTPLIDAVPENRFVTNNNLFFRHPKHVLSPNFVRPEVFKVVGPSKKIAFEPKKTNVAIVNTGGLCPGINNVLFELVNCLENAYHTKTIYGVRNGFSGFYDQGTTELCCENLDGVQALGGSFLGTSRTPLNINATLRYLRKHDISQLYVIGGDGSHKAAHQIALHTDVSVGCLPKTIDNDIPFIDMSFGFQTAVDKATEIVRAAYTEICGTKDGVGIVKLMGRDCGWIALYASMASYNVDICLIPEYFIDYTKMMSYVHDTMKKQGHCLIVVAEGVSLGGSKDPAKHLHNALSNRYNVKYIDPTYAIRGVPANTADIVYCRSLAQSAVHACMSGYTDFTVGEVDRNMAVLPLDQIVKNTNYVDQHDEMWIRLLLSNSQPSFDREERAIKHIVAPLREKLHDLQAKDKTSS